MPAPRPPAPQTRGDTFADLGELALASRLRRLSERLSRDVGRVYRELDIEFEPGWFPLLHALTGTTPRTVTDLARNLRWTHPAVHQLAADLTRAGLIRTREDPGDRRRRPLSLTAKGERLAVRLAPVWDDIRAANRGLLDEVRAEGDDLLRSIAAAERRLDARDMHSRVTERLRRRGATGGDAVPVERLEILSYRPAWRHHFESLNREWLESLFSVEASDAALLADPSGRILRPGGAIVFARLDGRIVGTGALIHHAPGVYELAKMAVTAAHRRHGVGRRLAAALLEESRTRGARTLFLETSPRLIATRRWYERLGFRPVKTHPLGGSKYERRSIVMVFHSAESVPTEEATP